MGVDVVFNLEGDDELRLQNAFGGITLDPVHTFELSGRIGFLVTDKALLNARRGYQNSRVEATLAETAAANVRDKDSADGWLVGGGLECAISDALRSRIEYRYSDQGSDRAGWDRHQVLAGVLLNL